MKRLLEFIMTLIVTAATYAIIHIFFITDLFNYQKTLPAYVPTGLAVFIGFIFYFIFSSPVADLLMKRLSQAEERLTKMNMKELAFSVLGCFVGLVLANLIGLAFRGFGALGTIIIVLLNILFGILGIRVARRKKDEVNVHTLHNALMTTSPVQEEGICYGRPKILDTSVIIDGRILDLLQTGFIEGKIIIPDFVLEELRHIADSADSLKRNRGRRGLDILNEIQRQLTVPVEIQEFTTPQHMEVDSMLLKMAEQLDAFVVTNDFNLNKVAEFQGVRVLNINELANAIKPVVLPGEEMEVTIIKAGKEAGQGIAYLNDGTMIVVDGGSGHIGETKLVVVTSVLQTAAGRMIFTKMIAAAS
ncbi:MAG: TRAM domain-containing protein [Anaerotignum sp.]|nr:TRAM domain-containing protein [Anaerotignum sp.]